MLDGYRLKHLFLKMSYDELEATCKREGWEIPFMHEIKDEELNYDFVWTVNLSLEAVSDEDKRYGVRLGVCWNNKDKRETNVNKLFKMNCVVLIKKD